MRVYREDGDYEIPEQEPSEEELMSSEMLSAPRNDFEYQAGYMQGEEANVPGFAYENLPEPRPIPVSGQNEYGFDTQTPGEFYGSAQPAAAQQAEYTSPPPFRGWQIKTTDVDESQIPPEIMQIAREGEPPIKSFALKEGDRDEFIAAMGGKTPEQFLEESGQLKKDQPEEIGPLADFIRTYVTGKHEYKPRKYEGFFSGWDRFHDIFSESLIDEALGGAPSVVKEAMYGKRPPEQQDTLAHIATGSGRLIGFMIGAPGAVTKLAMEGIKKAFPKMALAASDAFAMRAAKSVMTEAPALGAGFATGTIFESANKPTLTDALQHVVERTMEGAKVGATFGAAKAILPANTVAQRLSRIAVGTAVLDYISGQTPWDDRTIGKKIFDYGLDVLFLWRGLGDTGIAGVEKEVKDRLAKEGYTDEDLDNIAAQYTDEGVATAARTTPYSEGAAATLGPEYQTPPSELRIDTAAKDASLDRNKLSGALKTYEDALAEGKSAEEAREIVINSLEDMSKKTKEKYANAANELAQERGAGERGITESALWEEPSPPEAAAARVEPGEAKGEVPGATPGEPELFPRGEEDLGRLADTVDVSLNEDVEWNLKNEVEKELSDRGINLEGLPNELKKTVERILQGAQESLKALRSMSAQERLAKHRNAVVHKDAIAAALRRADELIKRHNENMVKSEAGGVTIMDELLKPLRNEGGFLRFDYDPEAWTKAKRKINNLLDAIAKNPEFKGWFANSVMRDKMGRPLVMFHATAKPFDAFNEKYLGTSNPHATGNFGWWFASRPDQAEYFIERPDVSEPGRLEYMPGSRVVPVFTNLKNPKVMTAQEFINRFIVDLQTYNARAFTAEQIKALRKKWIAEGHDGMLIKADPTLRDRFTTGGDEFAYDSYVVFPETEKAGGVKSLYTRGRIGERKAVTLEGGLIPAQQLYEAMVRKLRANTELDFGELAERLRTELGKEYFKDKTWQRTKARLADRMAAFFDALPSEEALGAAAIAGRAAKEWYPRTQKAIKSIFGKDAKVFAGFLASTSPQNPVDRNLKLAADYYIRWIKGDKSQGIKPRTNNKEQLEKLFRPGGMVMYAKNAARAVRGEQLTFEGMKVNHFWLNNYNDLRMTTLDVWMSRIAGIVKIGPDEKLVEKFSPAEYATYQEKLTRVADALGWEPAEVQSALWSFGKVLFEAMGPERIGRYDIRPEPMDALRKLTHEEILNIPEYSRLMLEDINGKGNLYRAIVESQGEGAIEDISRNLERIRRQAERNTEAGAITEGFDESSVAVLREIAGKIGEIRSIKDVLNWTRQDRRARKNKQLTGAIFESPNVKEGTDYDYAKSMITSEEQKEFRDGVVRINSIFGVKSRIYDSIGDWVDGAENSIYEELTNIKDFATIKYLAAAKGLLGRQKSVLPFVFDKKGPHDLFIFDAPQGHTMDQVRTTLDEYGLTFRTMVPMPDGTVRVVIYDGENNVRTKQNLNGIGEKYDVDIEHFKGYGEFVGAEDWSATDAREQAAGRFNDILDQYEAGLSPAKRRTFATRVREVPGLGDRRYPVNRLPLFEEKEQAVLDDPTVLDILKKNPLKNEKGQVMFDLSFLEGGGKKVADFVQWMKDQKRIVDDYVKGSGVMPDRQLPYFYNKTAPPRVKADVNKVRATLSPSKFFQGIFDVKDTPVIDAFNSQMAYVTNTINMRRFSKDVLKEFADNSKQVIEMVQPLFARNKDLIDEYSYKLDELRVTLNDLRKQPDKSTRYAQGLADTAGKVRKELRALEKKFEPVAKEHEQLVLEIAKKYADARIYLAASNELPTSIKLTAREAQAAEKIRRYMENTRDRLHELGVPVIKEKAYMPHIWRNLLEEPETSRAFLQFRTVPTTLKFMSRMPHSRSWIPSAHAAMDAYIPTVEWKLAYQPLTRKWTPWIETLQTPVLRSYMKDWMNVNLYDKPTSGWDKMLNAFVTLEYVRLIGLSASVGFKHLLKLPNTWAETGFMASTKAMPKAARATAEALLDYMGLVKNKSNSYRAVRAFVNMNALLRLTDEIPNARKLNEVGRVIAGQPVIAVEFFDNGTSIISNIIAHANKENPALVERRIWETILDANFRSSWDQPIWQKNVGVRAVTMFQMTPFKLFEYKMKLIKDAFSGKKDAMGTSATSKLIRLILTYGMGETIARANDTSILEMFLHLPFWREVFEPSPEGYKLGPGEPIPETVTIAGEEYPIPVVGGVTIPGKPAFAPPLGLLHEMSEKGVVAGTARHFKDWGIFTKAQKAAEGTYSPVYESPERYMLGLRKIESEHEKEARIKKMRKESAAKKKKLRKTTQQAKPYY